MMLQERGLAGSCLVLDETVEMLSFPPSIFVSRILALFAATFVVHLLAS